jgi:hypothetical protein
MKTAAQIARHPKARLHQELVAMLRATGSAEGAELFWSRVKLNQRLWKKVVNYGLAVREQQLRLNKVAFADCNTMEVDSALKAGNNLKCLYEIASGRASIAKDSAGQYKVGNKGLKIVKHATERIRRD